VCVHVQDEKYTSETRVHEEAMKTARVTQHGVPSAAPIVLAQVSTAVVTASPAAADKDKSAQASAEQKKLDSELVHVQEEHAARTKALDSQLQELNAFLRQVQAFTQNEARLPACDQATVVPSLH
jgi:TolA-binding protein